MPQTRQPRNPRLFQITQRLRPRATTTPQPISNSKRVIRIITSSGVLGIVALVVWQVSLQPSHNRIWSDEVAVLSPVRLTPEVITIEQIRDWRFDTSGPLDQKYLSADFKLSQLKRTWFVVEPFGAWDGIAHTFFIFEFEDQPSVSFSVEARLERGEVYSGLAGLFRQYELIYVWGTPRDMLTRRAVYLDHQVLMYPLSLSPTQSQTLFAHLAQATQELHDRPRFYNTLTTNCTNVLADFANHLQPRAIPFTLARWFTGYADNLLYRLGYISPTQPFDQLEQAANVSEHVKQLHATEEFEEGLYSIVEIKNDNR